MRGSLNKIFFTLAVMFLAVAVVPVKASSATVDNTMSKEKIQAILEASSFKDYYPQSKFKNIVVEMDYRYFKESECGINE